MRGLYPEFFIDGYKLDHRRQYPDKTEYVYSNFTARSSRVEGVKHVVVFGLQYFIQEYLMNQWNDGFFNRPIDQVLTRYMNRVAGYLGPNQIGVDHIRDLHKLGYLPLEIRALPEGTKCPLRVPMLTIENTNPKFGWLVNYFETIMSCVLWMPCTSATTANHLKTMLVQKAKDTGGDPGFVNWQGHDFSFRGMAGMEAACLSGAGHLLSFTGTDTMPALDWIDEYYPGNNEFVGGSVAATEHSVMCAGGAENEESTIRRLLDLYPSGIVSVVSDTWDFWKVVSDLLPNLKSVIMSREGKLVIRPDSGDPVKIICGDSDATGPAQKGLIECLWDTFGGAVNAAGYKVLDSHIGAIYGDSINYQRAEAICDGLRAKGFCSTNIVFGVGSYTYQFVTRDTYGMAMKATYVRIDGVDKAIFKSPKTDDGTKNSAKGRLAVARNPNTNELYLINEATPVQEAASLLTPVWRNGKFITKYDFAQIRARLESQS